MAGNAMGESPAMSRTFALALLLVLAVPSTAAAALKARGSVEQVHVTGAKRGAKLTLVARSGKRASQRAGKLGGAVFRNVKPGRYRVQLASACACSPTARPRRRRSSTDRRSPSPATAT